MGKEPTIRKPLLILGSIALFFVYLLSGSIFSAEKPSVVRKINPIIRQIVDYAMPELGNYPEKIAARTNGIGTTSLGVSSISSSPGVTLGFTYYDWQHNSTTGRMIGLGEEISGSDTSRYVHSTWMDLPGANLSNARHASYSVAAVTGTVFTDVALTFSPEYAGYFNLDVTPDNQAIIAGHYTPNGNPDNYTPTVWYDEFALDAGFGLKVRVDSALWKYGNPLALGNRNAIWPHLAFQVRPDGSRITHLTGVTYGGGNGPHVLYYFRREGHADSSLDDGSLSNCGPPLNLGVSDWDCPWVYDTAWASVALVTASKKSGKVALGWTANLPETGCDTCSINDDLGTLRNRFFNDLYYQTSEDYGMTWNPRINVTHFDTLTERWGPYNDVTMLWTGNAPTEELHLAWTASDIERYLTQGFLGFGSRIYHWAESFPGLSLIPSVASHLNEDPLRCSPNAFNGVLAKPQLSECNGNLYCLYADLWDGHNSDPANPDCSHRGYLGDFNGSVNGELMVTISDDNGLTFDSPHNLTNSPTPDCVGDCESEHFSSMASYGFETSTSDGALVGDTVLPRAVFYPNTVGTSWLPIMYVLDKDPGTIIFDNSTWQSNPVKLFYMACVDPGQSPSAPDLGWSINDVGWPASTNPGVQKDSTVRIESNSNFSLSYSVRIEELNGTPGWLGISGIDSPIPSGQTDSVTIHLNESGIIAQAETVQGLLIIDVGDPNYEDTLYVTLYICYCEPDTISTGVISLAVAYDARIGLGDAAGNSGVSMDYFYHPNECDTVDSIPGNTKTYLFDGSMIFGNIVNNDTILSNSIYGQGPNNRNSIYALDSQQVDTTGEVFNYYRLPLLSNADTTIGASLTYFIPKVTQTWGSQVNKTWHADQQFITKEFKIWAIDSLVHEGMVVGEVIDWDIPADLKDSGGTLSDNVGAVNSALNLLYIYGAEYNNDDSVECQDNDLRYGGMAFGYTKQYFADSNKWLVTDTKGYGGYHAANAQFVYTGWDDNELYTNMEAARWGIFCDPLPCGEIDTTDLHSVLTYTFGHDLLPGDTLAFYSVIATVLNDEVEWSGLRIEQLAERGQNFMTYFGCCHGLRGDFNSDGVYGNILDLTYSVDRIFRGGKQAPCLGEADINADGSPLDILDLTFLVDYVFRGGRSPYKCSDAPCNSPGCHE